MTVVLAFLRLGACSRASAGAHVKLQLQTIHTLARFRQSSELVYTFSLDMGSSFYNTCRIEDRSAFVREREDGALACMLNERGVHHTKDTGLTACCTYASLQ
jgi:hypothetical protein